MRGVVGWTLQPYFLFPTSLHWFVSQQVVRALSGILSFAEPVYAHQDLLEVHDSKNFKSQSTDLV